jgi:hypothetical protein
MHARVRRWLSLPIRARPQRTERAHRMSLDDPDIARPIGTYVLVVLDTHRTPVRCRFRRGRRRGSEVGEASPGTQGAQSTSTRGRRSTRARSRRSSVPRSPSIHPAERQSQGERSRRTEVPTCARARRTERAHRTTAHERCHGREIGMYALVLIDARIADSGAPRWLPRSVVRYGVRHAKGRRAWLGWPVLEIRAARSRSSRFVSGPGRWLPWAFDH